MAGSTTSSTTTSGRPILTATGGTAIGRVSNHGPLGAEPWFSPVLGAYETPIDKMLSLPPQRAILELVPDRAQSLVLTDYRAPSEGT